MSSDSPVPAIGATPDQGLLRDLFGTAEMRRVFSEEALLRRYVEAEVALAEAQGASGIIPADAAAEIAAKASVTLLDVEALRRQTQIVGYPILPLVQQLTAGIGKAGEYLHWGATTQDIMDTATVLQIRAGLELVERDLLAIARSLADLAQRFRDTPMPGRTHLQQALPVTFGYKAAVWLAMIERHIARLGELRPRVLVAELAGAAGTLASLGSAGLAVHDAFAAKLGLAPAPIAWHVARDGLAEAIQFLGLVTGSLGKIGFDVMLLMSTEVGEVNEPFLMGRGASSTMPQKRNPISSEILVAVAKAVRQHCGLMLDAQIQDLERATGPWHVEWLAIPDAFILSAGALAQARFMLEGLTVDAARMRHNLDLTGGLIVAEAVMMGLAPSIGRQHAHEVVYAACREALESGRNLADVLIGKADVAAHLSEAQIRSLTDPANYLGAAGAMVDRVLAMRER
jgi:3-carboxy-cis,cis-muconate cycloisomerase